MHIPPNEKAYSSEHACSGGFIACDTGADILFDPFFRAEAFSRVYYIPAVNPIHKVKKTGPHCQARLKDGVFMSAVFTDLPLRLTACSESVHAG